MRQVNSLRKGGQKTQKSTKTMKKVGTREKEKLMLDSHDFMMKKVIIRMSKQIKLKSILKLSKRLKEMVDSPDNDGNQSRTHLLHELERFKAIDHISYGTSIFQHLKSNDDSPIDNIDMDIYNNMRHHKLMTAAILELDLRLQAKLDKRKANFEMKMQAQTSSQASKSMKNLFKETASTSNKTAAIFVDSLAEVAEPAPKKSAKTNNNQLKSRKNKRVLTDLSCYMPADMRINDNDEVKDSSSGRPDMSGKHDVQGHHDHKPRQQDTQSMSRQYDKAGHYDAQKKVDWKPPVAAISSSAKPQAPSSRALPPPTRSNNNNSNSSNRMKPNAKHVSGQPVTAESVANGKEWKSTGLHPSWAAKMIVKPVSIEPFQGKKIVFDAD